MKKIFYLATVCLIALFTASCEDFLDTTNYWSKTTEDYPVSEGDADQVITGIYNNLNVSIGNNVHLNEFFWSVCSSDDCFGGGGANDQAPQAEDLLMNFGADMYNGFYTDRYKGVARCNLAIATLKQCGLPDGKFNQYMGEAHFMRAYYYYELASMFGNIPCPITTSADATQPQISGEALWGQIIEDLKLAIEYLDKGTRPTMGSGHADKYAAQALLGRCYLFYSGFYNDAEVSLPQGGTVDKAYVASQIDDCVKNSGYSLVGDFRNLWAYSNRCTVEDDLSPWKGKGLKWVEDDGGVNPEAMFMIKFNTQPSWSTTIGYSNQTALFFGVRGQQLDNGECFPFGTGWGMCPVNPNFVDEWKLAEPNDARRDASVISVSAWPTYVFGGDANIQESGYYMTKCMPVLARKSDGSGFWKSFSNAMYDLNWSSGNEDNFQLNSINDMVMIRFAEVLLMDAELNNNQASFDKVRARAGLPSQAISTDALRAERRWELALEGVRWMDMRRYGEDYAIAALNKQDGAKVWNNGVEGVNDANKRNGGYDARYRATKGFAPLPSAQISLSAAAGEEYKYKQNEGWGTSAVDYPGW